MKSNCLVVIPAMNEEQTIAPIINALIQQGFDVVVVDDGSTDNTKQQALTSGAVVLPLLYNLGAWNAMQTGFRYALQENYSLVITMDADGQHVPASLPAMIAAYEQGDCDVVIASCLLRGDLSRQVSWRFFKWLANLSVNDLTSGLRLYNKQAFTLLAAEQATLLDYQDLGVLLLLKEYQCVIREIPSTMEVRVEGKSRLFSSWRQIFYYLFYTFVLCFSKVKRRKKLLTTLIYSPQSF